MLVGDFNAQDSEPCLSQFLFEMNATSINKEPTCFQSLRNADFIDFILKIVSLIFITQKQYQRVYRISIK